MSEARGILFLLCTMFCGQAVYAQVSDTAIWEKSMRGVHESEIYYLDSTIDPVAGTIAASSSTVYLKVEAGYKRIISFALSPL